MGKVVPQKWKEMNILPVFEKLKKLIRTSKVDKRTDLFWLCTFGECICDFVARDHDA